MEFDFSGIVPAIPGLWNGMVMTLKLMALGVVGGIILGTILALMRLSHNKLVSNIAGAYDHCRAICQQGLLVDRSDQLLTEKLLVVLADLELPVPPRVTDCIMETLSSTIAVSPITMPVAWSNIMPRPIRAAG